MLPLAVPPVVDLTSESEVPLAVLTAANADVVDMTRTSLVSEFDWAEAAKPIARAARPRIIFFIPYFRSSSSR